MGIDPLPLDPEIGRTLSGVTTAILTSVLRTAGLSALGAARRCSLDYPACCALRG